MSSRPTVDVVGVSGSVLLTDRFIEAVTFAMRAHVRIDTDGRAVLEGALW
jgi:hypothetical protein